MGTFESLPSVATPNTTDIIPIEHGPNGGPYTTSQTTIADILALGEGSGGSASSKFDAAALAIPNLSHYWKCNDAPGQTSAADSVGSQALTLVGNALFGAKPLAGDGETSLATFAQGSGGTDGLTVAAPSVIPSSGEFTLFFLASALQNYTPQSNESAYFGTFGWSGPNISFVIDDRTSGEAGGPTPAIRLNAFGSQFFNMLLPGSLSTFLFTLSYDGSTLRVYIDGVLVFSEAGTISNFGGILTFGYFSTYGMVGKLSKIGIASSVLTQAEILSLTAGMN